MQRRRRLIEFETTSCVCWERPTSRTDWNWLLLKVSTYTCQNIKRILTTFYRMKKLENASDEYIPLFADANVQLLNYNELNPLTRSVH